MEKTVELYKKLLFDQIENGIDIDESFKGNAWPVENEREFLNLLVYNDIKSVLTVLSSGDYLFSLIYHGVLDIDTFDSMSISSYYALGIKKTLIDMIDFYIEFRSYLSNLIYGDDLNEFTKSMEKIISNMPSNYRTFWSELIKYNYDLQKGKGSSISMLRMLFNINHSFINRCTYLNNQEFYEKMKSNLVKSKITHYDVDIFDITKPLKFGKLYDVIFLSNVIDYYYRRKNDGSLTSYEDFKRIEKNLLNLIKDEGIILSTVGDNNSFLFAHSNVTASSLEFNVQILNVLNDYAYEKDRCLKITKNR